MPSWKKVIVSGSDAFLNALTVTNGITGSLHGTASWAQNAITSSYTLNAVSASYATTASYVLNAVSASFASTASFITASNVFGPFGANSVISASHATFAQTASYALNITISGSIADVDYIDFDTNASFASAIGRLGYDSGEGTLTFGLAGGNVDLKIGSDLYQYVYNNTTSSLTLGQVVYASGSQGNKIAVKLASAAAEQGSANTLGFVAETIPAGGEGWVMTEGNLRKLNTLGLVGGKLIFLGTTPGTYTQTPPVAPNHGVRLGYAERISSTVGSIYVKIDNGYELGELHDVIDTTTSASYGDLLVKSGSVWHNSKQLTGSYGLTGSLTADQIYATSLTASNLQVVNNITASSISATSASFGYVQSVTGSAVIIGQEYIILNTQSPAARYAGLQIYDSGSNATASIVWDSETNHFVYQNASGSTYSGGGFLAGPKNTGSLADITYPTQYRVLRSQGDDHVYNSNIYDDDTAIRLEINTQVTGSLNVSGGITGSLHGTASWAENAITASYVLNAISASYASNADLLDGKDSTVFATTGSNIFKGLQTIDGNIFMSGSNPLIYNNSATNAMLFGFFDGSNIYGPYYQIFGNNYSNVTQRGSAEFVYDNRNGGGSGFNIASFNGSTWTRKFRVDDNGAQVTGSLIVTGGITGSLYGTASWAENAITSSYSFNAVSSSYATNASSSLIAITASYALFAANGGGGGGGGATVTHTQLTASTTWSFTHNLNTLTPLLQVYDTNYEQIIPNEIVSINAFISEIRFDYTQAGYAVASSGGGLTVTGSTPRLVQTIAATTWSFAHNLGTKYPGFEVFDSNDDVVIPAGIHVVDENNAEIYFALPSTGVAIANFSGIEGVFPSSSFAFTASYSDEFHIGQTQTQYATVTSSINGSNTVFTQATGSYTSAFFKYTVASGSNSRSGEIMSVWNGTTVESTDNSTADIGTTAVVTSSVALSGADIQLNMQTNTSGWRIKSIATFI